jgi:ubiquinone/menaquinone biosynthesis C-methylase UbiE
MSPTKELIARQPKYQTRNPVGRYAVRRFFRRLESVVSSVPFENLLEVGCGEGLLLYELQGLLAERQAVAIDVDAEGVTAARHNTPGPHYMLASAEALPFRDEQFDLVVCCEVLEHLNRPQRALEEIRRVAARYAILSVPNEPLWRLLNLLRGAFVSDLGNTPGHVNHWTPGAFLHLVGRYFDVIGVFRPLPWTGALCVKRDVR